MKVFTLGYQGLDLGAYIRELVKVGAGTVIDVRETAWSNRPDFVKSTLYQGLDDARINYVHVRRAGNPSRIRKAASSTEECLSEYRQYLWQNLAAADELYSFVRMASEGGRPPCLLCYERDPRECHRSVLIERLLELDCSIRPIHLPFISSTQPLPFESPSPRHESLGKSSLARHGLLPPTE